MENINLNLFSRDSAGSIFAIDQEDGSILYSVSGLSVEDKNALDAYMNKTREFRIPQSEQIDDYEVMKGKPVDNETFFRLGLCTLKINTGITVIW